jgi:hypothetical protein
VTTWDLLTTGWVGGARKELYTKEPVSWCIKVTGTWTATIAVGFDHALVLHFCETHCSQGGLSPIRVCLSSVLTESVYSRTILRIALRRPLPSVCSLFALAVARAGGCWFSRGVLMGLNQRLKPGRPQRTMMSLGNGSGPGV